MANAQSGPSVAVSTKKLESQSRKEGLQQPISESNIGFALLSKMGYKKGEGLGKSKQGLSEPVPIELSRINDHKKAGLGREDAVPHGDPNSRYSASGNRRRRHRPRTEARKEKERRHKKRQAAARSAERKNKIAGFNNEFKNRISREGSSSTSGSCGQFNNGNSNTNRKLVNSQHNSPCSIAIQQRNLGPTNNQNNQEFRHQRQGLSNGGCSPSLMGNNFSRNSHINQNQGYQSQGNKCVPSLLSKNVGNPFRNTNGATNSFTNTEAHARTQHHFNTSNNLPLQDYLSQASRQFNNCSDKPPSLMHSTLPYPTGHQQNYGSSLSTNFQQQRPQQHQFSNHVHQPHTFSTSTPSSYSQERYN